MWHNQELVCYFEWQECIKEQENHKLKLQEEKLKGLEPKQLLESDLIYTTFIPPKYQESLVDYLEIVLIN